MKKKIVIFANGWGSEYLQKVVNGIFQVASRASIDVFSFIDFSSISESQSTNSAEMNIFRLPDLCDFDGAIIVANSFNIKDEIKWIYEKVVKSGIPAISVGYEYNGITSVITDNYDGMFELVNHVIREHGGKNIVFVGGQEDHLDSQIRLQAVQDAIKDNGMSLSKENIIYGDWVMEEAKVQVEQWVSKNQQLPDAFICANDVMAIGVCNFLKEKGYCIPKDVIVTGYDGIELTKLYDPVITSVSNDWHKMGTMTMQILLDKMNGKAHNDTEILKTKFEPGETCGCHLGHIDSKNSNTYFLQAYEAGAYDTHFRNIYLAIREADDIETLNQCLDNFFISDCWMEGKDFMLCLEPEFFNIKEENENLLNLGYSHQIEVICSLKDGMARQHEKLKLNEAMFRAADENLEPGMYLFVPVYSEGKNYGFAMLTRDMDIVLENHLYIWTRHMNQYLELVRRNLTIAALMKKFTHLSITDTLTGVYNRAGCEKITYPMLEEWKRAGGTGVVMLADIDRMKRINDQYGHSSGDLALRMVAKVLRSQIPSEWIIARFGGDEFFIGGKVMPYMDIKTMIVDITKKLEEEVKRQQVKFGLKISIGYKIIEPDSGLSVERSLQKADELMYEIKKCHHEESDRSI